MKRILFLLMLFVSITASAQEQRWPTFDNKTHTAEEQPFADLSQKIWDLMAAKDATALKGIFHPNCEFVHMGGYWGTEQELQTIGSGMIWYKHAEVYGVDVKIINDTNVAVYSTIVLDAEVGGQVTSHPFFVSQMFIKEKKEWRLASFVFTTRMMGPGIERPTAQRQEQCHIDNYPMLTLSDGGQMPQFGIGTFLMRDNDECYEAVLSALRIGYRHIDTAHAYQDEAGVGRAVRDFCAESGVKRSEMTPQPLSQLSCRWSVILMLSVRLSLRG